MSTRVKKMQNFDPVKIPDTFHGKNYKYIERWALSLHRILSHTDAALHERVFNNAVNGFAFILWGAPLTKRDFQAKNSCLKWHYNNIMQKSVSHEDIIRDFYIDPKD